MRLIPILVVVLIVVSLLVGIEILFRKDVLELVPVYVRGVILDATTGRPVVGAEVLSVSSALARRDFDWAAEEIRKHRSDSGYRIFGTSALDVTDVRGEFSCEQRVLFCYSESPLRSVLGEPNKEPIQLLSGGGIVCLADGYQSARVPIERATPRERDVWFEIRLDPE